MKLRVNVKMTNIRQFDVAVDDPTIGAGDLKALIFAAAKRELGEHDEMRIVSTEEVISADDAPEPPDKISVKLARARAVVERRPDLFPASVTFSRRRLYAALQRQGYRWDTLAAHWIQEATDVPTR